MGDIKIKEPIVGRLQKFIEVYEKEEKEREA